MSRDARLARFGYLPKLVPDPDILPEAQRHLWPTLGEVPDEFVLYGGTGLALHLGHRESVAFDFFSSASFAPGDLLARVGWAGRPTIMESGPDTLVFSNPEGVKLSFFGGVDLRVVAEQCLVEENGLVVASIYDLAGTKAKSLLDRSEWRDYVDIATLLRAGHRLPDIVGYAATIFGRRFEFPVPLFLRSLVYFEDGTASDAPQDMQRGLEAAVRAAWNEAIPNVEPYAESIAP